MKMTRSFFLALAVVLLLSMPAFADSEITVTGTGEVLVPADNAVVSLGVTATDSEVLAAQAAANEAIAAIRAALVAGGIDEADISTDYINIYAMYDYSGSMEKLSAYNANSTLAIRVRDIEKVGEVIDTAFGAGANALHGISFSATDTKEAREKALKLAVANAQAKAEVLAEAAGLVLRGIEEINEQNTYSYDRGLLNDVAEAQKMSGTSVQAARLTVSSTITVTFKADR